MSERYAAQVIEPMVMDKRVVQRRLMATFRCPVSGKQVKAQFHAVPSKGPTDVVGRAVKNTAVWEVRRMINAAIYGAMGHSVAGRMISQMLASVLYQGVSNTGRPNQTLSASEEADALIQAFKQVSNHFTYDEDKRRWVHKSAVGEALAPIDAQMAKAPLTTRYDQLLLARMLVEIANADGQISADEHGHLQEAIDPSVGSIHDLAERPKLTNAELAEASAGASRTTLLSVAWTVALMDENLSAGEDMRLRSWASGLGLTTVEADRARSMAQAQVLDAALTRMIGWGGHDAHARSELIALGDKIGLTREQVELAEAKYLKRNA